METISGGTHEPHRRPRGRYPGCHRERPWRATADPGRRGPGPRRPLLTATPSDTTAPQPAIFNPAPLGTFIETTVDKRTVRYLNGFDMTYEVDGRWLPTRAFITDGLDQPKIYPVRNVDALWPLDASLSTG